MKWLYYSLLYGLAMFAAGFALGTFRELVIVRLLGLAPESAELVELPVMLGILAFVSVRLTASGALTRGEALLAGLCGALLLAALDLLIVGMGLRGLSFTQALESFDPRTGTLFPFALALAALLPFAAVVARGRKGR